MTASRTPVDAVSSMCPTNSVREADELAQPVDRELLELLQRGRRAPEDPDLVEPGDQQLRKDARLRAGRREVREEAGALPVRDSWKENRIEILQHGRERLRLVGGGGREPRSDRPRLDLRQHRELADALEVRRDPLESERAVRSEIGHWENSVSQ